MASFVHCIIFPHVCVIYSLYRAKKCDVDRWGGGQRDILSLRQSSLAISKDTMGEREAKRGWRKHMILMLCPKSQMRLGRREAMQNNYDSYLYCSQ